MAPFPISSLGPQWLVRPTLIWSRRARFRVSSQLAAVPGPAKTRLDAGGGITLVLRSDSLFCGAERLFLGPRSGAQPDRFHPVGLCIRFGWIRRFRYLASASERSGLDSSRLPISVPRGTRGTPLGECGTL